jgi:hypothetical protein
MASFSFMGEKNFLPLDIEAKNVQNQATKCAKS